MPRSPITVRASTVLACLTLAACADQTVTSPSGTLSALRLPGSGTLVPARYAVVFAAGAKQVIPTAALSASGGRLTGAVPIARALIVSDVRNPAALSGLAGVVSVSENPDIVLDPVRPDEFVPNVARATRAAVSPNVSVGVPQGSNAPWLTSGVQWDLARMQVPAAWQTSNSFQGSGARVCIIDTGIDGTHQELVGQVVDSTSFVPNSGDDADPSQGYSSPSLDTAGHGSHVAGTVAAKGVVMVGVAPKARLMIAKVFAARGGTPASRVANAIVWCTNHSADVISMSLGGFRYRTHATTPDPTYQAAIDFANANGVIVVASAGNDNIYQPNALLVTVPAFNNGVISVGATGPFSKYPLPNGGPPNYNPMDPSAVWRNADSRSYYSNFGPIVTVFAPGGNLSATLNMPYRIVGGVIQGVELDGIYSVCSSISSQIGQQNEGGAPSMEPVNCLGNSSGYIAYQGTSMAAPHVSGLFALITAELGGTRSPARRARAIACVRGSTDNIGPSSIYGGGRVNAASAISFVRNGGCDAR